MKIKLVVGVVLALASTPALANTLTISILPNAQVVPQSASDPCIICATQQAHNPAGFGFNNFINTGHTDAGNFFSTALVGELASGDEVDALPYTVGQIGSALLNNFSFGVAIDVNSAQGAAPMTLDLFRLWEVDGSNNNINLLASFDGPFLMPDIRTGNGSADYLLSGFDLSSLALGDRLIFQAQFSGGTDGGESFYIVPVAPSAVPIPAALPLFGSGLMGLLLLKRKRRLNSRTGLVSPTPA